jgi:hypothetical protein
MSEAVTRLPFITRGNRAGLGTLLLALATLGAFPASPKRVRLAVREGGHVAAMAVSFAEEALPGSPSALKP